MIKWFLVGENGLNSYSTRVFEEWHRGDLALPEFRRKRIRSVTFFGHGKRMLRKVIEAEFSILEFDDYGFKKDLVRWRDTPWMSLSDLPSYPQLLAIDARFDWTPTPAEVDELFRLMFPESKPVRPKRLYRKARVLKRRDQRSLPSHEIRS